jgi:hypothetical protein
VKIVIDSQVAYSKRNTLLRWVLVVGVTAAFFIFCYLSCRIFITVRYEQLIAAKPHSLSEIRAHLERFSEREISSAEGRPLAAVVTSNERYIRFTWLFLFSIDVIVDSRETVVGIHADFE